MLEGDEWKQNEKDNPELFFAKQALAIERAAEALINSLRPEDAHRPLISYGEQVTWNLKRKSKRNPSGY